MSLICATYNVLHGYYIDELLENVRFMIEQGADIFCLQEAEEPFEEALREFLKEQGLTHWDMRFAHRGPGSNLALVWNTKRLSLKNAKFVPLPMLDRPSLLERFKGSRKTLLRGALVGSFAAEERAIDIASVHLAWEGGKRHRLRQLVALKEALDHRSADADIIAGDFNTIAPSFLASGARRTVEQAMLPHWIDALPDISWSFDYSRTAPQDHWEYFGRFLPLLGIRVRSRLDYIFTRNLRTTSATMLDLPGSDHRPLVGQFAWPER